MAEEQLTLEAVEASIAATIAPLKEQLSLVEGRERLILADLEETRAMKARLLSTLRKLDPTMAGPGKKAQKKAHSNGEIDAATVEEVRRYIDLTAPQFPDGFTREWVLNEMKEQDDGISSSRMKAATEALHSSGYITLHKVGAGGRKLFKRTEDLNGKPRLAV